MEIKDIMRKLVLIDLESTLEQVVEKMASQKVNSILVTDTDGKLIGVVDIVTLMNTIVPGYIGNRDFSVASFVDEDMFKDYIKDNKDKKVKYFMLPTPKVVKEDSSILDACIKATEGRQTRIPVVDDENKPVGVLTREGVKKYLAITMGFDVN